MALGCVIVVTSRARARTLSVLTVLAAALAGLLLPAASPAQADGPGVGTPWVVTLGDSYISGEAGRWAGSSNASSSRADALGSTAYYDNAGGTGETIDRCHRSKSAEAYVGGGVNGLNLACSGAETATSNGDNFKPGLDFFDNGAGWSFRGLLSPSSFAHAACTKSVSPTVSPFQPNLPTRLLASRSARPIGVGFSRVDSPHFIF